MTFEELQDLIAQGEGQRLDFKRGVPSVKDLALAVICLARADGGKISKHVKAGGRGELSTDSRIGLNGLDAPHVRFPFNPFRKSVDSNPLSSSHCFGVLR